MKISKELRVGAIALVALLLLYWGANFLKGKNLLESKRTFYAIYNQVDGLLPARAVTINGFKVGQVDQIRFHPNGSGQLIVAFSVEDAFEFSDQTVAKIASVGLLGERSIELMLRPGERTAAAGDTLTSDIEASLTDEVNEQVAPLKQKAENLLGSLDTAIILITGFLSEDTRTNFTKTFESVRTAFQTLEHTVAVFDEMLTDNQGNFNGIMTNVNSVSANLKQSNAELTAILENFASVSDTLANSDLAGTLRSLRGAVVSADTLLTGISQGKGTLGQLATDKALYTNLLRTTRELDRLLLDIKYNPNRYVHFSLFGSRKEYTEEEILKMEAEWEAKRNKQEEESSPKN